MDSRNSARSATSLNALLPQLAKRSLRQRRELAVSCPSAHGTGEGSHGTASQQRLLGYAGRLARDSVKRRALHHVFESFEGHPLRLAHEPLLYLEVAKLEEEFV